MAVNKLTEKQVRFIQYYLEVLNATKAAIMAGYSKRSAANIGYENMKREHVGGFIRTLLRLGYRRNNVANLTVSRDVQHWK